MNRNELRLLAKYIVEEAAFFKEKEVLTSDEAARYMGVSKSCLYKWTMSRQVPHYKPNGKCCYFNRQELEAWLQTNRVSTDAELEEQARKIVSNKNKI